MRARLLLLILSVSITSCATTKPLVIACISCSLLELSGACDQEEACLSGHAESVNYQKWIDGEEPPRIECRPVTIQ